MFLIFLLNRRLLPFDGLSLRQIATNCPILTFKFYTQKFLSFFIFFLLFCNYYVRALAVEAESKNTKIYSG
jgi:hypothetical protein